MSSDPDNVFLALPGVVLRRAALADLPGLLVVEAATAGVWDQQRFYAEGKRDHTQVGVAACLVSGKVRGFYVIRREAYSLTVLNLAALDPVARHYLKLKIQEISVQLKIPAVWCEPEY